MPYCRICGAKLEENAKFCHKCGTPVAVYISLPSLEKPSKRSSFVLPVVVLVAALFSALILASIVIAPLHSVNFNQTNQVTQSNITTLNLYFQADNAQVNIFTQSLTGKTILIGTSAVGETSILSPSNPVQVTFNNETAGRTLTVSSKVTNQGVFGNTLKVTCNIYLDPSLKLNLNIITQTGQISLTADQPTTFESLNFKSTTGLIQANIQNSTVIAGDISLKTTTGDVGFRMNQANVKDNNTISLQTTTGAMIMDIAENKTFTGNLQINSETTTGAINLSMQINYGVGAKIESRTQMGQIETNLNNFSRDKSSIKSDNYPAESNLLLTLKTDLGSIKINASYQSISGPVTRN